MRCTSVCTEKNLYIQVYRLFFFISAIVEKEGPPADNLPLR